jgi:hypothetical protein
VTVLPCRTLRQIERNRVIRRILAGVCPATGNDCAWAGPGLRCCERGEPANERGGEDERRNDGPDAIREPDEAA